MMRSVVSVSLSLAFVFWLLSLMQTETQERQYDVWQEALMYEVTTERPLVFSVPADSERLVLDLVGVIPPLTRYDAKELHPFEFELTIENELGQKRRSLVWAAPRVSLSDFPPRPDSRRGAKLMDKGQWATDSVERLVDLGDLFRGETGQVMLRLRPSRIDALLVRMFAESKSLNALGDVAALRLSREDRKELGALGSGLGFSDVNGDALRRAVGHRRQRLDTSGKRGRDYVLRRVLSSSYRASEAEEVARPTFPLSAEQWAAFNFDHDVSLEVHGPPGAIVVWEVGSLMPSRILELDAQGVGSLRLSLERPATLVLASLEGMDLSLRIEEDSLGSLISDGRQVNSHEKQRWLLPDYRRIPWSLLRPHDGVCFELGSVEGQKTVLLALRGIGRKGVEVDDVQVDTVPARAQPKTWRKTGELSTFEVWTDGPRATDTLYKRLSLSRDVERVCMRGPERFAVRAFAEDESVPGDVYEDPYDDALGHGYGWHYAPREIRRWVPLAPTDDFGVLLGATRMRMLLAQVRLERDGTDPMALTSGAAMPRERREPEASRATRDRVRRAALYGTRQLVPDDAIHAQRVFVRTPRRPVASSAEVWNEVTTGRTLRITEEGVTTLSFRVDPARLPTHADVMVNGVLETSVALRLPQQTVSLPLARGDQHVALLAPEGVRGFAAAQAADFLPRFVERKAYELPGGESLRFSIPVRRGEVLAFVFDAFTEAASAPYRFTLRTPGRLPETWVGLTSIHPEVRFWDRAFVQGGSFHARMDLPVPKADGIMEVELTSKSETRAYVRAVLLGQRPDDRPSTFSVSRRREP